jgi:putative acetyltransferase
VNSALVIREFEPGDADSFRELNEEWITRYFRMEAKDAEALADPQSSILASGGRILFAAIDGRCIGCCALLRRRGDEFEVAKMAVASESQGKGVGRKLLMAVVEAARSAGARRLYLETNRILAPAIRLYESIGFRHLPPDRIKASPYVRADVFMELILDVSRADDQRDEIPGDHCREQHVDAPQDLAPATPPTVDSEKDRG